MQMRKFIELNVLWLEQVFSRCIWLLVPSFFFFFFDDFPRFKWVSKCFYCLNFFLLMLAATYSIFLFSQLWCRHMILNILRKTTLLSWLKSWSIWIEIVNTLSSNTNMEMKPKNHVFWRTESAKVTRFGFLFKWI